MARVRGGGDMPSRMPPMPSPRQMLRERVNGAVQDALGAMASPAQRKKACEEVMAVLDRHAKEMRHGE